MKIIKFPAIAGLFFLLMNFAQAEQLIGPKNIIDNKQEPATIRQLDAAAKKTLELVRSPRYVKSSSIITIDSNAYLHKELSISLADGRSISFSQTSVVKHGNGSISWNGSAVNHDSIDLTFGEDLVFGAFSIEGNSFNITPIGRGHQILVEIDEKNRIPQHPKEFKFSPQHEPTIPEKDVESIDSQFSGGTTIRVLFAFTPAGLSQIGGSLNVQSFINNSINKANLVMQGSNLNVGIESAGIFFNAQEYASLGIAYARIETTPTLLQMRDNNNADIIALFGNYIVSNPEDACALSAVFPGPRNAYSVIAANCQDPSKNFVHELGHLLGGRHQIARDSESTPYSFGHGYNFKEPSSTVPGRTLCFRTVMAYPVPSSENCYSQLWLDNWSKPIIDPGWIAARGNAATADVARVVSLTAPTVATYRNTKLAGGLFSRLLGSIMSILD